MAIKQVNIRDAETVVDVVARIYGSLDNLYAFIQANELDNIDEVLVSTEQLNYDTTLVNFNANQLYVSQVFTPSTFKVKTYDYQSIYDICLQNYGTLDELLTFLQYNNIGSIDDAALNLSAMTIDNSKYNKIYKDLNIFCTLSAEAEAVQLSGFLLLNTRGYVLNNDSGKIKLN